MLHRLDTSVLILNTRENTNELLCEEFTVLSQRILQQTDMVLELLRIYRTGSNQ